MHDRIVPLTSGDGLILDISVLERRVASSHAILNIDAVDSYLNMKATLKEIWLAHLITELMGRNFHDFTGFSHPLI
ncbi:MAG: hypothetical protein ACE5NN_06140 [Candidatus Bathyarchaeia archaeon]